MTTTMRRRTVIAALLPAAVWPCAVLAAEPAFDVIERDWVDTSRQRPVPVRLYMPRTASSARPAPLVVFSHGMGGSRGGYTYLASHWASQGYAALHLQHVGSDRTMWKSGDLIDVIGRVRGALTDDEAVARVKDLRFALDRLLDGEFASRIDAARIVAGGHSYGANTALLAAGARVQRRGQVVELADPRIKAAILISAPPFYGEAELPKILGHVTVPSLHITATEDVINIPGFHSGTEDRVAVYDAIGSARKTLAIFEGGSHSMFTDRLTTGGAALNPKVKTATKELSLAFLKSVIDGDDTALLDWPRRFSDLVARYAGGAMR